MVRFILLFLVLVASKCAFAQDLIFAWSGEVIQCTIDEVSDDYVYFYESQDVNHELLFKMDVLLIQKIVFDYNSLVDSGKSYSSSLVHDDGTLHSLETNVDGIYNTYLSLFYQYYKPKVAFDIGIKRYRSELPDFVDISDSGSMVELGVSLPMKKFGDHNNPYRGFYIRGFGVLTSGTIAFDSFFSIPPLSFKTYILGLQLNFSYQFADHFYIKAYYGLANEFGNDIIDLEFSRADFSNKIGIFRVSGIKVGYIF